MTRIAKTSVITTLGLNPLREKLETLLPLIRQVTDFVGRRMGLSPEDREDLASEICLKLAANDYEKLRQFRGESKLSTFLKVLATNEATDRIRRERGKFRPAAKTRRRGDWACRYEQLRRNEGRSRAEVLAILEREGFKVPREELDRLDAEIAPRLPPRSFESADDLRSLPTAERDPEQRALAQERAAERLRLRFTLRKALRGLAPDDRAFLRLYCDPNAKARAARLAVMFALSISEVYRRYLELCKDLKRRLRELGIDAEDVRELLADWEDDWEISPAGPSPPKKDHDE